MKTATHAKGIVQRRPAGIHCLRSALSSNDSTGSGKIDREDVRWCLHDCGVTLDDEQSQILLDKYDRDGSGLMRIEELLSGLREPLSDRRKRVVEEAFGDLSPDNDGKLDIKMWQRTFDAYASGRALIGDVNPLVETLDSLTFGLTAGSLSKTGTVTLQDFERYHQDICVDVDNDDLFEAVVKAAWRSGGTTTAAAAAES